MFKKILTLLLVLCMPIMSVAAFSDTQGVLYENEISFLYDLGIIEGKTEDAFMPGDTLTRAEMVTIVLRLMGAEGTVPAEFADVPLEHWASKNIGTAFEMQLVSGISETEFAPEVSVTYPQAVKMLVCALGYDVQAKSLGGYPSGYLSKASQMGILSGTTDNGGAITRAMMAKLVANALEVNILVRTAYGDAYTYAEKENATLLNTYMGIEKITGRVTANSLTNLGGASAREGQFSIGDMCMKEGKTGGGTYIGRTVVAYVKEENEVYTAKSVVPKWTDGYKTIDTEDILPTSTMTNLSYETNDRIENAEILPNAIWVYNGVIKTDMTPEKLVFENGNIRLVAEKTEKAEFVFVTSYRNMIVDTVRMDTGRITFKNPEEGINEITLDKKDTSVKVSIRNAKGEDVPLKDVREWDVLSVAKEGNVLQIEQSYKTVTGKITEMGDKTVVIDNQEYKVAANVYRNANIEKPAVGMEANFILDFTGKIAAIDTEGYKPYRYAYLINAEKEKGISETERVKMFTEDGEMKLFTVSDGFELNDIPCESVFSTEAAAIHNGIEIKEQLVMYRANADGELLELMTAWDIKETKDSVEDAQRFSRFTEEVYYEFGGLYGAPARMYDFKYLLREKTKVFRVPEKYNGNDNQYSIIDPMSIGHVSSYGGLPSLTLYDIDEYDVISAMVTKATGAGGTPSTVGVIQKISKTLDDEGATVTKIDVLHDSGEGSFMLTDTVTVQLGWHAMSDPSKETEVSGGALKDTILPEALDVGDVIWYATPDLAGKVDLLRVVLRAQSPLISRRTYRTGADTSPRIDKSGATAGQISAYDGTTFSFTEVQKVSEYGVHATIPVTLDGTVKSKVVFSFDGVKKFYLYDTIRNSLSEISKEEIFAGDKIFTMRYNLKELMFVIYR